MLNPAYQPPELEHCLQLAGIRAVIASKEFKTQDYYKMMAEVIPEISDSKPGKICSKKLILVLINWKLVCVFGFK